MKENWITCRENIQDSVKTDSDLLAIFPINSGIFSWRNFHAEKSSVSRSWAETQPWHLHWQISLGTRNSEITRSCSVSTAACDWGLCIYSSFVPLNLAPLFVWRRNEWSSCSPQENACVRITTGRWAGNFLLPYYICINNLHRSSAVHPESLEYM